MKPYIVMSGELAGDMSIEGLGSLIKALLNV